MAYEESFLFVNKTGGIENMNKDQTPASAKRRAARLYAVQALYQMKANDQTASAVITEFKEHRFGKPVDGYEYVTPDGALFADIVNGVSKRRDDLHSMIEAARQKNKTGERAKSDDLLLMILLCGSYELLMHTDIAAAILINDYVNVTHAFYDRAEAGFVNGILDRIKNNIREESESDAE